MDNEGRVEADIQKVWKAGILERVRKMNDKEAEDIVVCIIDILTARKQIDWLVVHIIKQALSGKAERFSALVLRAIADWLETADSK